MQLLNSSRHRSAKVRILLSVFLSGWSARLLTGRARRKRLIMFEQLNKDVKKTVKDGINTDSMEFVALYDKKRGLWPEVIGKEIPVEGFFFVDGKYGKRPLLSVWERRSSFPSVTPIPSLRSGMTRRCCRQSLTASSSLPISRR